jgi:hypothetical protein
MKMEQTGCSEMLAFKLQTPVNHPEESIRKACLVWMLTHLYITLILQFYIYMKFQYRVSGQEVYKIHAYVLVTKSVMKFMCSTVYRAIQKDFYAHPYTSMWAEIWLI